MQIDCPWKLATSYAVVASLYVSVSSSLAGWIAPDQATQTAIESVKGMAFVALTSLALFAMARSYTAKLARTGAELRATELELRVALGRADVGLAASAVARDVGSVLAVIGASIEAIPGRSAAEQRHAVGELRHIIEAAQRGVRGVVLATGGRTAGVRRPHGLGGCAAQVVDVVRRHPSLRDVVVEVDTLHDPIVDVDIDLLCRAVASLVVHAAEAAGCGGGVGVRVHAHMGWASLHVDHPNRPGGTTETGRPLSWADRTGGFDLALFAAVRCAEAHGGTLDVGPSPLGGARMTMRLPTRDAAGRDPAPGRVTVAPRGDMLAR